MTDLDGMVEKIHQMSKYLGDEVVIVGSRQAKNSGFAIIADVKQGGLDDLLKAAVPGVGFETRDHPA